LFNGAESTQRKYGLQQAVIARAREQRCRVRVMAVHADAAQTQWTQQA
jgi:hypothetical protein